MIELLVVMIGWAVLWVVPASIAGYRRRRGLRAYWWVLLLVIALEVAIAMAGLELSKSLDSGLGVILSPYLAVLIGVSGYCGAVKFLDRR